VNPQGIKLGHRVNNDRAVANAVAPVIPAGCDYEAGLAQIHREEPSAIAAVHSEPGERKKPLVQLPLLIMACCSAVFMLVMLFSGADDRSEVRSALPQLMQEYAAYLKRKGAGAEASQQAREVRERLLKIAIAGETGDTQKARRELYELMLLDRDAQSPLYKQCSIWLRGDTP
jgi:hypothetical protein